MKLQLVEKITIHKAHRERMRCARCGSSMYQIHHVFYPNLEEQWYISCGICGNATDNYWFKKNALRRWKEENNVNYVYCP